MIISCICRKIYMVANLCVILPLIRGLNFIKMLKRFLVEGRNYAGISTAVLLRLKCSELNESLKLELRLKFGA